MKEVFGVLFDEEEELRDGKKYIKNGYGGERVRSALDNDWGWDWYVTGKEFIGELEIKGNGYVADVKPKETILYEETI